MYATEQTFVLDKHCASTYLWSPTRVHYNLA
jgi:hypothetical protein